jgi:hypothetical protein
MEVTEEGMSTDVREVQWSNALFPMDDKEDGMSTDVRAVQSENA